MSNKKGGRFGRGTKGDRSGKDSVLHPGEATREAGESTGKPAGDEVAQLKDFVLYSRENPGPASEADGPVTTSQVASDETAKPQAKPKATARPKAQTKPKPGGTRRTSLLAKTGRSLWTATRMMVVLTVILGIAYPMVVTGLGQVLFGWQANGSQVTDRSGEVVGSRLIGQSFTDEYGNPLPQYFQPRPSAAGDGYDPRVSSGSNQGPENPELISAIEEKRAAIAAFNGVDPSAVPPDALTASGSGLDPDISPAYAEIQISRVARERDLGEETVRDLVAQHTHGADLGYIGQPGVNVLELNLALDEVPR